MVDKDGYEICPICYTKLNYGTESYTDDPLKTPNHFMPELRGNQIIRAPHIKELQDKINQYETDFGLTPTEWTPVVAKNFVPRPKYINELREAVEAIIVNIGITLEDWLSWDENDEPTLGITEWLDGNRLTKGSIVRGMHIEQLRKHLTEIWENFSKGDVNSITSITPLPSGGIYAVTNTFNLQKNQLWSAFAYASREYYNSDLFWTSQSIASAAISSFGAASAATQVRAYGGFSLGGFHPGVSPFSAETLVESYIQGMVPVIPGSGGITAYPCAKTVWNPIKEEYEEQHLFIKADCVPVVTGSGSYQLNSVVTYTPILYSPGDIAAWNALPVTLNPYHSGRAEVRLIVTTTRGTLGGGTSMIMVEGAYVHSDGYGDYPPTGVPTSLEDFDIDLAKFLEDNFPGAGPTGEYVTFVRMDGLCAGIANSWNIKVGQATLGATFWTGQIKKSGGFVNLSASFTIDNINLYYKVPTP